MQKDGEIDYRGYTLPQLKEALSLIDKRRYPINYRNIEAELSARPMPMPAEGVVTEKLVGDSGLGSHSAFRRIFFSFCWFLFVWFVLGGIFAGVMGVIASRGAAATTFTQGYLVGKKTGDELGRKYGAYFMIGGLLVAIVGTAAGVLPGTRPRPRIAQQAAAGDARNART